MTETVLYIVHPPPGTLYDWGFDGLPFGVDKRTIHMAKIAKAIKFALRNNLPIIIETAGGPGQELDRFLQEQNIPEGKVRVIHTTEIDNPELIASVFKGQKIERFIVMGHYKELCCLNTVTQLRMLFPDIEIIILKGDNNISWRNTGFTQGPEFESSKDFFKERRKELGIAIRPLNRRMSI